MFLTLAAVLLASAAPEPLDPDLACIVDRVPASARALILTETASDLQGIEEQHLTVERIALTDVPAMIADGRITDAKSIIGLTLALRLVEGR